MTACVLDASVTLSWIFEDEVIPAGEEIFRQAYEHGVLVPAIWPVEVANVLLQAGKRGRIDDARLTEWLVILTNIPTTMEDRPPRDTFETIVPLARAQGLTACDASYLDLAMRHKLPLATKDAALRTAAQRVGVDVLPA
ncbi:MAG: type II toxin-antitoxin system VapC family toxin [Alphaproteobacteria bacterium]|nr:type II toxin-antitoxin system VapC family toxin [Alphaproteobacteria bacterium]